MLPSVIGGAGGFSIFIGQGFSAYPHLTPQEVLPCT
jgi:hypothetical protein